jgi:hypothetical protein
VVWQLWKPGKHSKKEKQWPSSCEWWGCIIGGGHFQSKSKEICVEGKLWVTEPKTTVRQDLYRQVHMKPYNELGELELQMKSGWRGLLTHPLSLHVTSFCGVM